MATGDDMYKAILKEIGAEESNMDYLFNESFEDDVLYDNHEMDQSNTVGESTKGGMASKKSNDETPTGVFPNGNGHLLNHFESEPNDKIGIMNDPLELKENADGANELSLNSVDFNDDTNANNHNNPSVVQQPKWKQMLEAANAQQEQLMGQMINLQKAQKESSPRTKIKHPATYLQRLSTKAVDETVSSSIVVKEINGTEGVGTETSPPVVLKEINDNNPSLTSSAVLLHPVQQISTRNVKLQNQWQSQKEKSAKLQDKLTVLHTKLNNRQEKWEKEQEELFSPTRSPTKIPKWRQLTTSTKSILVDTPALKENIGSKTDCISPTESNLPTDKSLSEELEASKARILALEAQLEESGKHQKSQQDEISDWKDRFKKRDAEHKSFLLQFEIEKKSWKDEISKHHHELETRDNDLKNTKEELLQQIAGSQYEREQHVDELKQLRSNKSALKEELEATQNQMKSKIEESQKQVELIKLLEDENQQLKSDFTRKDQLERTQNEIKSQMKIAMEQQTQKTREFQSRIQELQRKHAEEVEHWKAQADNHRHQAESVTLQMETKLKDANARHVELERKHDKEVKEWQLLLDANIAKAVADDNAFEDGNILKEDKENTMVIGATSTTTELLSPIRKAKPMHLQQSDNEDDENSDPSSDCDNSANGDLASMPSQSMNMIDDILEELGAMDMERTAILREINSNDDIGHIGTVQERCERLPSKINSPAIVEVPSKPNFKENTNIVEVIEGPPKLLESSEIDASEASNESEILDETLHLLNNLKSMLMTQGEGNEHETTVLERLEVLSELMQTQEQSNSEFSSATTNISTIKKHHAVSSCASVNGTSFALLAPQENADSTPLIPRENVAAMIEPWSILVEELKNRCDFLEQDRDEVTRITEEILEMERASHKAELDAAIATTERKANETIHKIQLEANQEISSFFQNIYSECDQEAFNYANQRELTDESSRLIREH